MNKIEIDGRVLEYQVHSNGCEFDTWYWTDFYEGTTTVRRRQGLPFFGKVVFETHPRRLFRLHIDIESPFHSTAQVRESIREQLSMLNNLKIQKNGKK